MFTNLLLLMYSRSQKRQITGIISSRISREIISNVEDCIRKNPQKFKDKSAFLKRAILLLLRHYGFYKVRILRVEAKSGSDLCNESIKNTFSVDEHER